MRRQLGNSLISKHSTGIAATGSSSRHGFGSGQNGGGGGGPGGTSGVDGNNSRHHRHPTSSVDPREENHATTTTTTTAAATEGGHPLRRLSRSPYNQPVTRNTATPHKPLRSVSTKTPPTSSFSSGVVASSSRSMGGGGGDPSTNFSRTTPQHSAQQPSSLIGSSGSFRKDRASRQLLTSETTEHTSSSSSSSATVGQSGTSSYLQHSDRSSRAVQRLRNQVHDAASTTTTYPSPPATGLRGGAAATTASSPGGRHPQSEERDLVSSSENARNSGSSSSSGNELEGTLHSGLSLRHHSSDILSAENHSSGSTPQRTYSSRNLVSNLDDGIADKLLGFCNLGNTCFMNSTMQVMLRCPRLRNFLLNAKLDAEFSRKTPLTSSLQEVVCRMFSGSSSSSLSAKVGSSAAATQPLTLGRGNSFSSSYSLTSTHGSIAPSHFKECLASYKRAFAGFQQHDAQEFLRFALEGVNDECNRIRKKPSYIELKDIEGESTRQTAARWMDNHRTNNDSVVQDEFCGQFLTQTACHSCRHVSVSCEPFLDVSLGLPKTYGGNNKLRVNDCISEYFSETQLTHEEHGFRCEKCKKKTSATRTTKLYQLPQVLVLHLKRFKHHRLMPTKVNDTVWFPVEEDLQVQQHLTEECPEENTSYRLLGVVNHMGSAHSGHYTAFVRTSNLGASASTWHEFNDSHVTPIRESAVVSSNAYVLFFERRRSKKL